jgi:hypothetical protein
VIIDEIGYLPSRPFDKRSRNHDEIKAGRKPDGMESSRRKSHALHIVRIETPRGHGTGFLCLYNETKTFCGIATAMHVVDHADEWQEPIRIYHQPTTKTAFLLEADRVIFSDWERDSAVILFSVDRLKLPEEFIPIRPLQDRLSLGAEIGWLGFPAPAS